MIDLVKKIFIYCLYIFTLFNSVLNGHLTHFAYFSLKISRYVHKEFKSYKLNDTIAFLPESARYIIFGPTAINFCEIAELNFHNAKLKLSI